MDIVGSARGAARTVVTDAHRARSGKEQMMYGYDPYWDL
jgi:hypothetical protein